MNRRSARKRARRRAEALADQRYRSILDSNAREIEALTDLVTKQRHMLTGQGNFNSRLVHTLHEEESRPLFRALWVAVKRAVNRRFSHERM